MNNLQQHKIKCPECGHEFTCELYCPIIPGIIGMPLSWVHPPKYECPKCHHKFSGYEVKRTKPASIWEILLGKL